MTSFRRGSTYHMLGFVPRSLKPNLNRTMQTWEAYQRVSSKLELRPVSPSLALVRPLVPLLLFFAIIDKARLLKYIPNLTFALNRSHT